MSKTMFEYNGPTLTQVKVDVRAGIQAQVNAQLEAVNSAKEQYLGAWIAETGLLPSECELCYTTELRDGAVVFKCWVRKRTEE